MQKIGIGYENYKEFIDKNMYYIDKTFLIRDIVEKGGKVTLFTRPRRFGKTLTLSMLRTFFELEYDSVGNVVDNRRYFECKKIMDAGDKILSMMGQYPVINLSLKSAKQVDFRTAFLKLRSEIVHEFRRHDYLKNSSVLNEEERQEFKKYSAFLDELKIDSSEKLQSEVGRFAIALRDLSGYLKKHHGNNVIILLDEYDVPLENSYYAGFYDEMVAFIRSLFESALKTNDALEFAVVTGCLRISKESIFTGMNNLKINSIRDYGFSEGFGFTPEETEKMLEDYGIDDKIEEVRKWYNGYIFGEKEIYNPWSVISYVYSKVIDKRQFPEPYWANTSSNQIIKDMVLNADETMKSELDTLISGGTIEKKIHEDITYGDIHESEDNLWNFLFFTGYMKKVSERLEGEDVYITMSIPNVEIRSIYKNQIRGWFDKIVKASDHSVLYKAILSGDTEAMADYLSGLLEKSISYFDSEESFYHGFFLSLLYGVPSYSVRSNREEGNGRTDIVLYPNKPKDSAIIFELKVRKKFNEMKDGLEEAFKQIHDQKYAEGVLDDGYAGAKSYGICFCKKSCIVGEYPGE
ncbi:PD-(D/E)XK nuclease superfamily protein [Lachnospiraceae bacterium]|nr:PD-(D/E)XK nuclease superfamily protein [Lachnospiraceae bacterium]